MLKTFAVIDFIRKVFISVAHPGQKDSVPRDYLCLTVTTITHMYIIRPFGVISCDSPDRWKIDSGTFYRIFLLTSKPISIGTDLAEPNIRCVTRRPLYCTPMKGRGGLQFSI